MTGRATLIGYAVLAALALMTSFWTDWSIYPLFRFLGLIFVIRGIWELVSALLLRRGYAWAGWGWGNPPEVEAWRGALYIGCGISYLLAPVLTEPWAKTTIIAGTLGLIIGALILPPGGRSKNKGS